MESKIRNEKIWIGAFSDAPNKWISNRYCLYKDRN